MYRFRLKLLSIALVSVFSTAALAELPAPIKRGHPRLYTTRADLDYLKAQLPLRQKDFSELRGSISFDYLPKKKGPLDTANRVIFGRNGTGSGGFFVARVVSAENVHADKVGVQVFFMNGNGSRISKSVETIYLKVGEKSTILVGWDAENHRMTTEVTDGQGKRPINMLSWSKDAAGTYLPWSISQQVFAFSLNQGEELSQFAARGATRQDDFDIPNIDIYLAEPYASFLKVLGERIKLLPDCRVVEIPGTTSPPCDVASGHRLHIVSLAQDLALAYRLTGEEPYLTAARTYATLLMTSPLADGKEWSMGGRVAAMGILYDWLFDEMKVDYPGKPGQSYLTALAERIKATIAAPTVNWPEDLDTAICGKPGTTSPSASQFECARPVVFENPAASPTAESIARFYIAGHQGSAVTAIAVGLLAIAEEHTEVLPLIATAYSHFDKGFLAARAYISADGGHHMGWAYGVSSIPERVLMWRSALVETAGAPIFQAAWQSQLIYPYIYGLRNTNPYVSGGDSYSFPASGDNFNTRAGDEMVGHLALWAATNGDDATAWSFYKDRILPARGTKSSFMLERLYWPQASKAQTPHELPLARHFGVAGHVLMRDSWDYNNATLLEFKSTSFSSENHHHLDQNSFSLYYKAPLLLDSGLYETYGSSHWENYYTRSIAHNTITVYDPTEVFKKNDKSYSNDGGQWFPDPAARYPTIEEIKGNGPVVLGGIRQFETAPSYSFTTGDASKAYSAGKLKHIGGFVRSVLFLNAPTFQSKPVTVVFDSVRSKDAQAPVPAPLPATFLLHTAHEPVADAASDNLGSGQYRFGFAAKQARIVTIRNGGGMLTAQTICRGKPARRCCAILIT